MKIDQVDSSSQLRIIGGKRTWEGSTVPASPQDGDDWIESAGQFAQPWTYNNTIGIWVSAYYPVNFGNITNISTTNNTFAATWFYNAAGVNRIFVGRLQALLVHTGGVHNTTNFFNFKLNYFRGDGVTITLWDVPETSNGLIAGSPNNRKRVTNDVNLWMPGNTWTMEISAILNGTGVGLSHNFIAYCRNARP